MMCNPPATQGNIQVLQVPKNQPIKTTDAFFKYKRCAAIKQIAWGTLAGFSGAFLAVIVQLLIQGHYVLALGFLGPAAAAIVGTVGLSNK